MNKKAVIQVKNLVAKYGDDIILDRISFDVYEGEIFAVLGGSGSGKSTLLKNLLGLHRPASGKILIDGDDISECDEDALQQILRKVGVLYQSSALFGSMTLAENVALPLKTYTDLNAKAVGEIVSLKLALVGLAGFEDFYPSEISGGMQKRVGVARAMALDPDILFFDEPSAGLDPLSARMLDDMILELRDSLGTTMVVVTHELASIFAIADDCVFLDAETKTMLTTGNPRELRDHSDIHKVRAFLNRGEL